MTFEVGAVLEDAKWQAPVYCFEKGDDDDDHVIGRNSQFDVLANENLNLRRST